MNNDDNNKEEHKSIENISEESGIIKEFWDFLCENKKFWLIPILIVLLLLALLLCASPAVSPFIYALF
jgi:hypothetical protein